MSETGIKKKLGKHTQREEVILDAQEIYKN